MKARRVLAAAALAAAITSVAPAFVDGAGAVTTHPYRVGAAVTRHAAGPSAHGAGIGSAVTLHKVHGRVVHVGHHRH